MILQVSQQIEQVLAVIFIQCGGGLIQNEQSDILAQRLCNFDQLLFSNTQFPNLRGRVYIQPHLLQHLPGSLDCFIPVDYGTFT